MDEEGINRLRDSAIAAALHELSSRAQNESVEDTLALDRLPDVPTDIAVACEALADIGQRPTTNLVHAHLVAIDGSAPPHDELRPHVRAWKARQWKTRQVGRAYRAFCRLNAEQRAAFFSRLQIDATPDPPLEDGGSAYSMLIRLNDGTELMQSATRRTTAWIRYHNIRDRLRPRVVEIILREHVPEGCERVLRHWTRRSDGELPTGEVLADEV